MSEDRYPQLVRAALSPLVEEVPDGPRWSELEELSPIARRPRPQVSVWAAAVGAAFTVLAVLGATSLLMPAEEPSTDTTRPTATTTATPEAPGVFVPPTRSADGMTYLALTLLDGSHIRLAYPDDLDLTSDGLEAQTVGSLEGTHSRVIGVHYGTPGSFIAKTEETSGPGALVATFPGFFEGSVVQRWEFADEPIAYLVYDFEPWTVYVWDGIGGSSMGDDALASWSVNLRGETNSPGFLVLDGEPPLQLVDAAEDPGPDGPDIRVDGSSGSLLVFINDCDRMTRLDEESYGDEVFAFCDEPTNTLFFAGGSAEVQERIHRELQVNPPLPGIVDEEPPRLDQVTNARVHFSDGFGLLTEVDIDAGSVTLHEVPELAPGDPLYKLVSRGDVLVFYGQTDIGPAAFAVDPDSPGSPVLIDDEAWFFVPSAVEDRVWIAVLDPSSPETIRALKSVREVTVDGVVTTPDVAPPDGRWPVAAVDDGLVFQGDDVLEIWDPESQEFLETFPGPFPVAAWGNRLVTCTQCDQLHLIDLDADTRRTIDVPIGVAWVDGYDGAFSPDGRYVAVPGGLTGGPLTPETELVVVLVDFEAGSATVIPGTLTQNRFTFPQVAWSSDGEWVFMGPFAVEDDSGELRAYRPGDATAYRIPIELANEYFGMAVG